MSFYVVRYFLSFLAALVAARYAGSLLGPLNLSRGIIILVFAVTAFLVIFYLMRIWFAAMRANHWYKKLYKCLFDQDCPLKHYYWVLVNFERWQGWSGKALYEFNRFGLGDNAALALETLEQRFAGAQAQEQ